MLSRYHGLRRLQEQKDFPLPSQQQLAKEEIYWKR